MMGAMVQVAWLQVACGGALGALARYGAVLYLGRIWRHDFPVGVMAVNIAGSALMGALWVVLAHKGLDRFMPFLMTGILGGFTTFSAFSMELFVLLQRGQMMAAVLYGGGSVLLSLAAFGAMVYVMQGILA